MLIYTLYNVYTVYSLNFVNSSSVFISCLMDLVIFRAITNMDIKLDFVPPSLINFISRQLIGNGHKLYQKVIPSFYYALHIWVSMCN